MAKTKKKLKVGDERMTGAEPEFSGEITRNQLSLALNWYNYYSDPRKNMKWVYDWMKPHYRKHEIDRLKASTSNDKNQNLASMARILSRGATNVDLIVALQQRIDKILKKPIKAPTEEKPVVKKAPPEIPNPLIADLDDILDMFYRTEYKIVQDPTAVIQGRTPTEMTVAHTYFKELLDEILEHGDHLKARQKVRYIEQIEKVLDGLGVAKANRRNRAPRAPRAKKVQPASKVVANLQHAKDSAQYNAASIPPEKILDSMVLYVFHTDYRSLTKYVAKDGGKLGVKGTSIINYDETLSFSLTLRKPSEVIPDVLTMARRSLDKRIDGLTTKKAPAKPRVNKKQLLLRNFTK